MKKRKEYAEELDTIFILTREDVVNYAREMGMPAEVITDDVLRLVKKGLELGLFRWGPLDLKGAVKDAISWALKS